MTIITAWSASVVVGSNSREGQRYHWTRDHAYLCGWHRSVENGLDVKSSLVTRCFLLRGPRLKLNVLFICRENKCAPTEPANVLI